MGVLYEVLFKPMGRSGGGVGVAGDGSNAADAVDGHPVLPPEWVLDGGRDGSSPVWRRRYTAGAAGPAVAASSGGRRVAFLDAVQVREFERDVYDDDDDDDDAVNDGKCGHDDGHRYDGYDDDVDYDSQTCIWTDDWSWDEDAGGSSKTWCSVDDDNTVLVAVSVTVLGVCIGLAYLFAPVRWLFHQLLID